jgi:hypothetical protein
MKCKVGDVVRFKNDNNKLDFGKVKSITKDGQVKLWILMKTDHTIHSSEITAVLKLSEKFGDIVERVKYVSRGSFASIEKDIA